MVDISVEAKTVEREFVEFGSGDEYPAGVVLDFLNKLEGTDGFVAGVRCSGLDADVADELSDLGVISHSHSVGYYVSDESLFEEIRDEIWSAYE